MNSFAKYSVAGLFAAAVMGSVVYQKENWQCASHR